jgi:hypothetical protein
MRVLGLGVAGVLALTAPIAAHAVPPGSSFAQFVPAPGHRHSLGWLRLGLAPGTRSLEPVERRMGSASLRTAPLLRRVGSP